MLKSIRPELVHLERSEAGYTGDMEAAISAMFESGVQAIAANGVIGDPTRASAEHGTRYWEKLSEVTLSAVSQP